MDTHAWKKHVVKHIIVALCEGTLSTDEKRDASEPDKGRIRLAEERLAEELKHRYNLDV